MQRTGPTGGIEKFYLPLRNLSLVYVGFSCASHSIGGYPRFVFLSDQIDQ